MKQKLILLVLVIGLTVVSQSSFSLGMGKIQVYSALNEPLQSSIELISHADEDLQNLEVKLASSEDYQKVGLDRSFVPANIMVALDEDNPYMIRVTSNGPVTEPIVSLLLDVNWNNGRILREFTILLDPPVYESSANVQVNNVVVEPIQEEVIEAVDDEVSNQDAEASMADAEADNTPALQPRSDDSTTYTNEDVMAQDDDSDAANNYVAGDVLVEAGDTLWRIANNNKVGDLSTHQMMMAIYNSNPSAFLDNNINQLIKGSRLTMPTADEAASIGFSEALAQVESHHQSWAPAQQDYTAFQTEDDPVSTYQEPDSSLDYGVQLSGGDNDGSDAGQSNAEEGGDAEMQAIQEDLYNKDSENTELKERISELEDIVEQQQEAFEIQDDSLANLENQLGSETTDDSDLLSSDDGTTDDAVEDDIWSTVDEDNTTDADTTGGDDALSLSVDDVNTNDGMTDDGMTEDGATDEVADDTTDSAVTEPATTEPASPPKFGGGSSESESMVDTAINWVMDNLRWVLIGLGGLIVLLILPKLLRRSDDSDDDTSFLDDIKNRNKELEAGEEELEEDEVVTKMNQPLMDEDAADTDGEDDGDDVLAELDKSIQFDEDDDDVNEEADEDDPFANAGEVEQDADDDGFDLDGFLNDDDDYDANTSVTADHSETMAGVNFDEDESAADDEAADEVADTAEDDLDLGDDDLFEDFDLDEAVEEDNSDETETDDLDTDEATDEVEAIADDGEDDFSFDEDFDFDLDDELDDLEEASDDISDAVETATDEAADAVADNLDEATDEFNDMLDISDEDGDTFEIDDTEEDTMDEEIDLGLEDLLEEGDAIDTKLDLAKAYIDMGDAEGAKNLLDEIINEGTDAQVDAAKKLLDDM